MGKNNKFLTGNTSEVLSNMAECALRERRGKLAVDSNNSKLIDEIADFERIMVKQKKKAV